MALILLSGCQEGGEEPEEKDVAKSEIVLMELENAEEREKILVELIEELKEEAKYTELLKWSEEYFSTDGYRRYRMEVRLMEAQAFENLDRVDEAARSYGLMSGVNVSGSMPWLQPAVDGWCRMVWKRNRPASEELPSDRQLAYEKLAKYISMTRRLVPKFGEEKLKEWSALEKMLKRFQESGEVAILK